MTYDAVNRLSFMTSPNHWSQTLNYTADGSTGQYGNMSCAGTGCPAGMTFSGSTNRIATINGSSTGVSYDAAGNMLGDGTGAGSHTFTWDAENRMASVTVQSISTTTFVYNALGQRVKKNVGSTPQYYYYDASGNQAGVRNSAGSWTEEFFPPVAGINYVKYQNGSTYFLHTDMLATTGMATDSTGAMQQDILYYPWGQLRSQYGIVDERFAGLQERDAESQLDPTPNRMFYNYLGRWLTPDPAGVNAINLTDPQTWNMYPYVRNNPTTRTDPSGLYDFQNPCEKANKQCNGDFKAFKKEFKNSLNKIKQARNGLEKGSKERARLDAVLKTYGKAGDNNGMTVTTGALPGTAAAATVGSAVTFDTSKNANAIVMAINAGHEGTHVMDNLDTRSTTAPLPNFSVEYRGYETSAWVAQGLGLPGLSAVGYSIYTSGQGFNDAGTSNLIMSVYPRANPGESYLDPLPYHDPWDKQ
jgi:RHS repeat-associated protein